MTLNVKEVTMSCGAWKVLLIVPVIVAAACGPGDQASRVQPAAQEQPPSRALVIAMHVEPTTLAGRPITTSGITPAAPTMLFNAWLVVSDSHNVPRPQLAVKLPELNSADWQVFPDGQMETIYRLKPGLVWQDGVPLSAEDVVFGWQVFTWPALGVPADPPIRIIQEVTAPDDRTVAIRWKQPYGDAGALGTSRYGGVPPMPRHLLEAKFRAGDVQAFLNDPYWTSQFVGSGPYRLDRWEPGSFIQASSFSGFVEGPPKIDQIRLVFVGDPNAAVANLLAGEIHLAAEDSIGFEQAAVLKQQWDAAGGGVVVLTPNKARFIQIQFKSDYVSPRAILDLRVRRALLEATDRPALSEAILDGQVAVAHTLTGPVEEYFADLDRLLTKYPLNPQEADGLMSQAGFARGGDGFFADASGQRLSMELRAFAAQPGQREATILADQWKKFGVDVSIHIIPAAQAQDLQQVSAYPALRIEQTGLTDTISLNKLVGSAIATAEKRWAGVNRGGWQHPDYDRFVEIYVSSLDRAERNRGATQALKLASEELPVLPLYYLSLANAYTSALRGPVGGYTNDTAWDNVREWHWVR
jgi:peptide/nickel transport system substrate-binding protein